MKEFQISIFHPVYKLHYTCSIAGRVLAEVPALGVMGGIYGPSFGHVIANLMILALMESVCGKINLSSGT